MKLTDIQDPKFLKSLSVKEMEDLSSEIRTFLIQSISKTGGHLASNLGVVELTIALHYVFNSPTDKIFFDVGHQSYTHKILTGRAAEFEHLRQYEGLSGFEKRKESVHDVWEAGHSSTSLSAALGMAVARDMSNQDYHVIPVIGDGALSSGMALEALNEIGSEKRNMIIVFNDNNMSISKNVGALTSEFSRLRSSSGYTKLKASMKKNLRTSNFGEAVYSGLKSIKDAIKESVLDKGIFQEFNLDYIGPIDGHNLHDLIQVFEAVKDHEGPIVVHVITKKGKGYVPCENDKDGKWHGVGPFNVLTCKALHEIPDGYMPWSQLACETVRRLAEKDDTITAITPAMITGSYMQKFFAEFPDRSFDTGIAEEHAATFAAGMAISGLHPYFVVYSSFLQRCYDQINHDICRMDLPVVIGIDHAGLVGPDGETHHGIYDIGLLSPLPNMILSQACDAEEMQDLITTAFHQKHPFAIRFPKGCTKVSDPAYVGKEIPLGTWVKYNDTPNNKVAVLTYGEDVSKVLEKVTANALPVTVINCRFMKPFDEKMLIELSQRKMKCIVYEVDMKIGGLGEHILGFMNDLSLPLQLKVFGIPDEYIQQGSERLLRKDLSIDLNTLMEEVQKEIK
ncbi:MAG: 1-deoxy-D-xylulose-5-phosphate synthase [Erysipelotrichaceae bacterium]|nr:1-deoxy-D-xylulose-5-phosphate synthase [Erysipelotrichaceae bacterium]